MPSIVVQANTDGVTAFTTPVNKIAKIAFLEIDNQHTDPVTITIADVFTTTPTLENPTPSITTVNRKIVTVQPASTYSEKIEGTIEILGACVVAASATSAACNVTIVYDFE